MTGPQNRVRDSHPRPWSPVELIAITQHETFKNINLPLFSTCYTVSAPFKLLLNFPKLLVNLNMRTARLPIPGTGTIKIFSELYLFFAVTDMILE